jgi:hypothetical protein
VDQLPCGIDVLPHRVGSAGLLFHARKLQAGIGFEQSHLPVGCVAENVLKLRPRRL